MSAQQVLIAEAERLKAPYPQYAGHWDGWEVAELRRDIKSRGAVVGRKGDLVLLDPASETFPDSPSVLEGWHRPGFVTVFLPRHYVEGGCDTSIKVADVIRGAHS